ncbi:MAG: DUF2079 domain-containing protein [Candidatus Eisenbacteria bacterium]|uniref:DUF2079 domain-containing protein n=1 Tax=Eiseniibacteriota bacterium TaxID=2212470 RepID=A0A538S9V9_UNCEI|nr:MAG: DUF2079 domain-containing protein [Candidatus Eisenbacteria bacterium]
MLSVLRGAALALAVASAAVLPLIALNLTHAGSFHLERFREPTWILYGSLLLHTLLRRDPLAFARAWAARLHALLSHPRFFLWMSGTLLALYLLAAWAQHLSFHTFSHDFSMIDEALVPRPHRPLLYSPLLGRSFLSEHFSPILAALVPIHAVIRSPYLLVILQPVALWSGGLVLRNLLARAGVPVATANLACLVYLNHPVQTATLLYLFHMECLLPVLALSAFRYYKEGAHWKYAAAVLLALAVKEDVGLYLAAFGLYAALVERRRAVGFLTAAAGVGWTVFAIRVAMPAFGEAAAGGYAFLSRWSAWGDSAGSVLGGFLTHPIHLVRSLLGWSYVKFFAPLCFVPFFAKAGVILVFLPWLLPATSGFWPQQSLGLYYGIPLLTFSAVAGAMGLVSTATVQAMSCFYPVLGYRREKILIDRETTRVTADYAVLRTERTTWPVSSIEARAIVYVALASGKFENRSTVRGFYILRRIRPARPR